MSSTTAMGNPEPFDNVQEMQINLDWFNLSFKACKVKCKRNNNELGKSSKFENLQKNTESLKVNCDACVWAINK